ncbi:hypothetical protein [Tessaracoccus coleopterorum]
MLIGYAGPSSAASLRSSARARRCCCLRSSPTRSAATGPGCSAAPPCSTWACCSPWCRSASARARSGRS